MLVGKCFQEMVAVHDRGIHDVLVRFCHCKSGAAEPIQLIHHGFWPASWDTPRTLFTMVGLYYTIDGNFSANLRDKPMDIHGFPLTLGAAYFANEDDWGRFAETLGPLKAADLVSSWYSVRFGR